MAVKIKDHSDLDVFKLAFDAAERIYLLTKNFPVEERYSLTDQIRRSSRSVCANIAEAWRKRRYEAAFVHRLNSAEAEASESQVWIEFCLSCGYIDEMTAEELYRCYDQIIGKLVIMMRFPRKWLL